MLARLLLSLTLILGLVAVGSSQDKKEKTTEKKSATKKKSDDLNDRVLDQVKRSLGKFEKELGKKKVEAILGQVERGLKGTHATQFHWKMQDLKLDPKMLHKHLQLQQDLSKAQIVRQLSGLGAGKNRRMIGVILHSDDDSPVRVKDVIKDSAAEKAGVKAGDVIIKVNGKKVEDPKSLSETVQGSKGKVKIAVQRGKKNMVVEVEPKTVKNPGFSEFMIEFDELKLPHLTEQKIIDGKKIDGKKIDGKKIKAAINGHGIIDFDDDIFKKIDLPEGASGIIRLQQGDGDEIELRIEDKEGKREIHRKIIDAHSKKKTESKKSSGARQIERRIEVKSDLSAALEKLQKQMKELQMEIKELKKSKN